MTQILELQADDRGLQELLTGAGHQLEFAAHARQHIAPIVTTLIQCAQDAGVLREDVTQPDIALIPIMVGAVIDGARGVAPDAWRRTLAIVLDGLRPGAPTPLPGAAPTPTEFDSIMRNKAPRS
jgi:transcriptional regulator SbtR-like protein